MLQLPELLWKNKATIFWKNIVKYRVSGETSYFYMIVDTFNIRR